MLAYEEALARILATVPAPVSETVPLAELHRRVTTEQLVSPLDLPPFDNSAMDGYAVLAADVGPADPQKPSALRLIGRAAAGEEFSGALQSGQCVRLFTGSPLPRGADAVVMQEETRVAPEEPDTVHILAPAERGENIRRRGEDVSRGSVLLEAGERVTTGHLNLLGGVGVAAASVGRRPRVGLLATGSELREPGQPLGPGQIYESNRLALATLIGAAGGIPRVLPLVPDDAAATRAALLSAAESCDAVVTSGGVSVGELDYVKAAWESIGGELNFWRVAMRPGRPFVFGRRQGRLLFGLPGNPVSAWVTFLLLVRPALLKWQGAREVALPSCPGRLLQPLENQGERRHFTRVCLDADGGVSSAGLQTSHSLSSLARANGLVDVPPRTALPAGAAVPVLKWE